ncbi:MAG: CBS domain-containing protein [Pseudomonadota bacterium]
MKIGAILDQKTISGVSWIEPNSTIKDALAALADKGIGTLIVSADGQKPKGILSERDIVRSLARVGVTAMGTPVDEVMTPNPVCCSREDDSSTVLSKMSEGRFRHVPVIDGNSTLIGLVSIGDIVKARMADLENEKEALVDMIAGR